MGTSHRHPRRGLDPGYARVFTIKQSLARQLDAPATAGISTDRICSDKRPGTTVDRPGRTALIGYAREGGAIVVHTLQNFIQKGLQ